LYILKLVCDTPESFVLHCGVNWCIRAMFLVEAFYGESVQTYNISASSVGVKCYFCWSRPKCCESV